MVSNDFWVVFAMLLYFVAVLTIGFVYAKRSNSSTAEYFLGGRGVGPWLTALSAEASDMSGWLLMGLPGVAYFTGASDAMWTAIGRHVSQLEVRGEAFAEVFRGGGRFHHAAGILQQALP